MGRWRSDLKSLRHQTLIRCGWDLICSANTAEQSPELAPRAIEERFNSSHDTSP